MNLCILISLALLGLVTGLPARMEKDLAQELQERQQLMASPDSMTSLTEMSDVGGQHAEEGARKARFLWGGFWAWPYWPHYYYSYPRSWGYSYWW